MTRIGRLVLLFAAFFICLVCACNKKERGEQATEKTISARLVVDSLLNTLSGEKRQLVEKLVQEWDKKATLTSILQAGKMLGIDVSNELRYELLQFFLANLDLHKTLARYHPYTFVLSNKEKRIAQFLVIQQRLKNEFPLPATIAKALRIDATELETELKFLARLGFLFDLGGPQEYNLLGYSFGDEMSNIIWDFGIKFHTFSVAGLPPFNVGCAKEAIYLLLSKFPEQEIVYQTIDPYTTEPIRVIFKNSEIISTDPERLYILEGGSCGANSLFLTKKNALAWATTKPYLQNPPTYELISRFAELKSQFNQVRKK